MLLRPLLLVGKLDLVAAFQHVVGLAMAVLLYAVLLRLGVPAGWPRWPPRRCCSTAISSDRADHHADVMFEACIVAGLAALLWHPRPAPP